MESYGNQRTKILRQKAITKLGGKCCQCGFEDQRALQIDHVDACGAKNRISGAIQRTTHVLKNPHLYQLLCANCNWIKRAEKKENGLRWGEGYVAKLQAVANQNNGRAFD